MRVLTPTGIIESRRLPGSGAGPSPDRMFIGSEGILGIITEAWMRLQDRPKFRAGASVPFPDFFAGAKAVRADRAGRTLSRQLPPARSGRGGQRRRQQGEAAVLVLAFESADHPLEPWMKRALECCADHGGKIPEEAGKTRTDAEATHEGAAGAWRKAFLNAPYLRDTVVAMGMVSDTFETAITWDRFANFNDAADGDRARRDQAHLRQGQRDLPLHPCLSRRSRAVLHVPRAGQKRFANSSNGTKSSRRYRIVDRSSAARSRIIMRSAATIAHGTTASGPTASRGP